jgi:hypothetical protein
MRPEAVSSVVNYWGLITGSVQLSALLYSDTSDFGQL